MYDIIDLESLQDFTDSKYFMQFLKRESVNTLCVFDVDGVFFNSLLDPHTYTSNIDKNHMDSFRKISETDAGIWVFTNREKWVGSWGDYEEQLEYAMERENPDFKINKFESAKDFIEKFDFSKHRRSIIWQAEKPSRISMNVIKIALMNYQSVLYFASQDVFWDYKDKTLLDKLSKESNTSKIILFDIK